MDRTMSSIRLLVWMWLNCSYLLIEQILRTSNFEILHLWVMFQPLILWGLQWMCSLCLAARCELLLFSLLLAIFTLLFGTALILCDGFSQLFLLFCWRFASKMVLLIRIFGLWILKMLLVITLVFLHLIFY